MKKMLMLVAMGFAVNALVKRAGKRNAAPRLRAQNAGAFGLDGDGYDRAGRDAVEFDDGDLRPEFAAADDGAALDMLQQFDAHTIALAESALARSVGNDTRSVATLLLEEHTRNQAQLRTLRAALEVEEGEIDAATRAEQHDDATLLQQLERLDSGTFEAGWIGAARASHARMLEHIDDVLLADIEDTRLAEHVRLLRDDVRAQLQNLDALAGGQDEADMRAA